MLQSLPRMAQKCKQMWTTHHLNHLITGPYGKNYLFDELQDIILKCGPHLFTFSRHAGKRL